MKVETRDPWAFMRDDPNTFTLFNTAPRTRATFEYPPKVALSIGWQVFWRALGALILRRRALRFWLED